MRPVETVRGNAVVVLGMPHAGTWLPDGVLAGLNARGREMTDTDWHVDRLYDGLLPETTVVRAYFHRYLIDANRDPQGESLYPGQNTTGLCPVADFDGEPIYEPGAEPDPAEIDRRCREYHAVYHEALQAELDRVREAHGVAILFDCHSIRSTIPHLFEGTLPDFNIGTNDGTTCAASIESIAVEHCQAAFGYSSVLNGRFKGGWTTRHYGRADAGIHAIQIELAQSTYLQSEAAPFAYDGSKAARLRDRLAGLLDSLNELAFSGVLAQE
jgi:N-formylglutamate deformylase